jgi:hypothetical protein
MINVKEVRRLRESKNPWTLKRIGDKFGVTQERIRQILQKKEQKFCKKHHIKYLKVCRYCYNETNYKNLLQSNIRKHNLNEEIERLSKKDRRGEVVLQRKLLVRKLHDDKEFKLSFSAIGKLLHRHHSSIIFLYRN